MVGPGTVLSDRFEIVREIARGGMAEIFEARDLESGGSVAVKVLRDNLSKHKEAIARFHREARVAASFDCRNIVKVLTHGVTENDPKSPEKNWPYIVMELLVGHDLAVELRLRAPLPVSVAASYIAQACRGMIEAHAAGIIHRDLKPTNLFLTDEDGDTVLKILDFGIAKLDETKATEELTLTTAIFGSPLYMSPESFRAAKSADIRSDVWSLGIIFYEMLTGAAPFQGINSLDIGLAITRQALTPPSQRRPDLPPPIDNILSRALEKDPERRYQTMRELLAAVEPFAGRERTDTPTREHQVVSVPPKQAVISSIPPRSPTGEISITEVDEPDAITALEIIPTTLRGLGPVDEDSHPTGPPLPPEVRVSLSSHPSVPPIATLPSVRPAAASTPPSPRMWWARVYVAGGVASLCIFGAAWAVLRERDGEAAPNPGAVQSTGTASEATEPPTVASSVQSSQTAPLPPSAPTTPSAVELGSGERIEDLPPLATSSGAPQPSASTSTSGSSKPRTPSTRSPKEPRYDPKGI